MGSCGEGTGNQGVGFEILGVVLYLRDCNNNHTSTTGLVASIILSTVDQKCMGVKSILVWVCVDVSVHFVNSKTNQGWGQSSNVLRRRARLPLSSSGRAPPPSGKTRLCHRRASASFTLIFHSRLLCTLTSLSSPCVCSVHR